MRIGEGVGNGQMHIGNAKLSLYGAIVKLNHGMNHRLRMHHNADLFRLTGEEPPGLNHLKAFVHHGGRINRHLAAHLPVGVIQGIFECYLLHLLARVSAEGTTRGGEDDAAHRVALLALQTLENGRVLAVNGQQFCAMTLAKVCYQLAGRH